MLIFASSLVILVLNSLFILATPDVSGNPVLQQSPGGHKSIYTAGPVIHPVTTIAPETDIIPVTNVQPVVHILPADYIADPYGGRDYYRDNGYVSLNGYGGQYRYDASLGYGGYEYGYGG
ncbi:hypothetical protein BGZ98_002329 [Dissophora globulifera]|nr:hypothetical protein BGZ98_002329 [Dissophora globulifera]